MPKSRPDPGYRRLVLDLPVELHEWLQEAAGISHRTEERVVRDLIEYERARWDRELGAGRAESQ